MKTTRTVLALALTLPLYAASCLFIRHPFTAQWESLAKSLVAR